MKKLLILLLLTCIPVAVFAATVIDNFNSYSNGDLNGQGSWSGSTKFDVQGTTVQEGAKAVQIVEDGSGGNISLAVTPQTTGIFGIYMRSTGTIVDHRFRLIDAGSVRYTISFREDNTIRFTGATADDTLVSGFSTNQWYLLEVQIDQPGNQARARVDGGAWTAYQAPATGSWTDIDTVRIDSGDGPAGATDFFDYIYYDTGVAAVAPDVGTIILFE